MEGALVKPRILLLCLAAIFCPHPARAHLSSNAYLRIELDSNGALRGQLDMALRDLDAAVGLNAGPDGQVTWGMVKARRTVIEAYALSRLGLSDCVLRPEELLADYHAGAAYAVLRFRADCAQAAGALRLTYRLLFDLDPTHRGLLTLARPQGEQSDVLSPDRFEVVIDRAAGAPFAEFERFVSFGVSHILYGYDHMLFVAVLMIVAAFRRDADGNWRPMNGFGATLTETLKILTAFTLAHAIALTLAVFRIIDAPARLVDPLVAVTIMLAAIDNVKPILPRVRWTVAFGFGLIHGLAFATALAPMRLRPSGIALALGGFNIGVELGQLALALLLVPIVFVSRRERLYPQRIAPALSGAAFLLAAFWFVERVMAL
jgi:hypothetical protein